VTYLEKAVQLTPYDYQSRNNLGIIYGRQGQTEKALNEFATAIRLKPDEDPIKINLAVLYERQKEYRKSGEILDGLILKSPRDANLHFRKGLLLKKEGRMEEAISEYNKSIELAPQIINPYEEIGNIYLSHFNDSEKARDYYSRGIEAAPKARIKTEELRQVIQDLEDRR
jgi:superkiller protein 3